MGEEHGCHINTSRCDQWHNDIIIKDSRNTEEEEMARDQ